MPFTDIVTYFVIAILGLAYPISLQVLTRLDEKYGSVNILKRFEQEFWGKAFTCSLYASITAVFLHILWKITLKSDCKSGEACYFYPDYILLFIVSLLIFAFLFYIKKIFIYYSPYRMVDYLKSLKDDDQQSGFNSLADIFYLSIRLQDATLNQTLHTYFYQRFRDIRIAAGTNEVIYPAAFYQMGYNALIEAGEQNSKKGKI